MLLCTKCHIPAKTVCPSCRKTKTLTEPKASDPVFLFTLSSMQVMLAEPILEDAKLPYSKVGTLGGMLGAPGGMAGESYRFFVPFAVYEQARALIEDTFVEDTDIMSALHEYDEQ